MILFLNFYHNKWGGNEIETKEILILGVRGNDDLDCKFLQKQVKWWWNLKLKSSLILHEPNSCKQSLLKLKK